MKNTLQECIKGKNTSYTPIWFMRQAGRYLPEFREIRKKNPDFIKLCLNPNLVTEITLPAKNVTSCTFGGPNFSTLYITTASQRLSEEQKLSQPLAGSIFSCELNIAGIPEPIFMG